MGFYASYELLELDRDDGVKTFLAREVATGRPVKVHLFPVPAAPYQAHLLKEIEELPESESARIIDRGSHLGTRYVVTDRLADYPGLLEWVSACLKAAGGKAPAAMDAKMTGTNVTGKNAADQNPAARRVTIPSPKAPATFPSPARSVPWGPAPLNSAPPSPDSTPRVPVQDSELNRQFANLFTTAERPVFVPPPDSEAPKRLVSSATARQTPAQPRASQAPPSPKKTNLLVILGYTAIGVAALLITMFFMLRRR